MIMGTSIGERLVAMLLTFITLGSVVALSYLLIANEPAAISTEIHQQK
jgi:hypothetical protein